MADYHCSIKKPLSRAKGKSLARKAAYNGRTEFRDERTGELTKDYAYKGGLLQNFVMVDPKAKAPEWLTAETERQRLISAAIRAETRKDAREGQEIVFGFVHELGYERNRWMLNDFLREQFTRREIGRVAIVDIHAPGPTGDQRNTHAHVILLLRKAGPEGFGERLPALEPHDYERIRQKWAEYGAKELRKVAKLEREKGREPEAVRLELEADRYTEKWRPLEQQRQAALERGDLAYAETLKDKVATKHRGPNVDAMEKRGIETERGNIYRDTVKTNDSRAANAALKLELEQIQKAIAQEQRAWEDRLHAAAIEKEKIERRFVEPQKETRAGRQERELPPPVPATRPPAAPRPATPTPAREIPPAPIARQGREGERQTEQRTLRRAIDKTAPAPAIGKKINQRDTPAPAPNLAKAAKRTISGTLGALGKLADGFSLDGLTPKEKHEAAKVRHKNEREAEEGFDSMANITAAAKALEQEQQREEEHRQRLQRDRDRDR